MTLLTFQRSNTPRPQALSVDLSIECGSTYHQEIETFALFMFFIYPIGTPLALLVLMFRYKEEIRNRTTRRGGPELEAVSFLIQDYHPHYWYFPIVDMVRRLALTSLLLVLPDAGLQVSHGTQ